jgi:hypothetical protein
MTLVVFTLVSAGAFAAKTYQVTGPVVKVTDTSIIVKKGKDDWEVKKSSDTKVTGELKEGSKVTIKYSMTADEVEVKEAKKK